MIPDLVVHVAFMLFAITFMMLLATVFTWVERKQSAIMSDRIGANRCYIRIPFTNIKFVAWGLFHGIADGGKLLLKENFTPLTYDRFCYNLAPWLAAWQRDGYHVHLLFLWLKSAEFAVTRVAERVRLGGHDVPAEVVRRRYAAGSQNLFQLYMPLVDSWQMFDNSEGPHPVPIAAGDRNSVRNIITDVETWRRLEGSFGR